ncbi:biopolymer transport protein ExbD [Sphingobium sp. B2D3A]|uniref:ExbD/TolR family protein n=1 Tax=Sphingobium TaxID=165695 RepID=UPI0015ECD7C0|nr:MULTISPECIES: biopolymer transporter ExbD [Sphingobium]MCW2338098.1 biopolymer transport protein ExbD [Sphingobium sp. B2D3A]MCW2350272.1 biopolymer transport protein ExbD [Sphingobium sp. B12D2B]MCW2361688.1 biopolymer transport protein ExbD [Sphingobium sp. B10D3B]MCW2366517.1 biopolymer transport protein ExbD [Sphingobium sp. B7D2B]MCW2369376.1 biopolymer transport protein ExbD [Sphingobium sp. B11D3D]
MAMSGGRDDGEPMMEMNTTPLIDVMLVLLIMFIITIPIQTHAVKIDLPQNADAPQNTIDPVKNRLTIDPAGTIYWNGAPVDRVTLRQYLDQTSRMAPEPELQFEPDQSARYVVVDEVLAIIKRAGVTKLGFVGNDRYGGVF